jgi:hypothetical protein
VVVGAGDLLVLPDREQPVGRFAEGADAVEHRHGRGAVGGVRVAVEQRRPDRVDDVAHGVALDLAPVPPDLGDAPEHRAQVHPIVGEGPAQEERGEGAEVVRGAERVAQRERERQRVGVRDPHLAVAVGAPRQRLRGRVRHEGGLESPQRSVDARVRLYVHQDQSSASQRDTLSRSGEHDSLV